MNLLASDNSESPMNARPPPTVDGHTSLEAGTPPTKEAYVSSYSVPWYHQKKWRILMLLGGIILIGAIAGGIAGGILASKNNKSDTPTSTTSSAANIPTENASPSGALPPGSSQPPVGSASGAETVPTVTGGPPSGLGSTPTPTPLPTSTIDSANSGLAVAPVVNSESD